MDPYRQQALIAEARRLGISPVDLATIISYETGGKFSTSIRGGAGNRHIGLIQFGPSEQRTYGAYQGQPFGDQMGAAGRYLEDRGVQPGMGLLDLYSTVNAGRPGRYKASDRPGYTVTSHVQEMMGGHRDKAEQWLAKASQTPQQLAGKDQSRLFGEERIPPTVNTVRPSPYPEPMPGDPMKDQSRIPQEGAANGPLMENWVRPAPEPLPYPPPRFAPTAGRQGPTQVAAPPPDYAGPSRPAPGPFGGLADLLSPKTAKTPSPAPSKIATGIASALGQSPTSVAKGFGLVGKALSLASLFGGGGAPPPPPPDQPPSPDFASAIQQRKRQEEMPTQEDAVPVDLAAMTAKQVAERKRRRKLLGMDDFSLLA